MCLKKIRIYHILLLFILIVACKNNKEKNQTEQVVKKDKIIKSEKSVDRLLSKQDSLKLDLSNEYVNYIINFNDKELALYSDVYLDKEFAKASDNSDDYLDFAISLLKTNKLSETKRFVVMGSMSSLSLSNRIKFIELCIELHKEKIINNEDLSGSFVGFFGEKKIFHEYKNKNVIALLENIILDEKPPKSIKKLSEEILSGETSKWFKENEENWNW